MHITEKFIFMWRAVFHLQFAKRDVFTRHRQALLIQIVAVTYLPIEHQLVVLLVEVKWERLVDRNKAVVTATKAVVLAIVKLVFAK